MTMTDWGILILDQRRTCGYLGTYTLHIKSSQPTRFLVQNVNYDFIHPSMERGEGKLCAKHWKFSVFLQLSSALLRLWGLIWFIKAQWLPQPRFHLTLLIWNISSFKLVLWLKTKGRLSQRAGFLPPAFENSSQQIMVNKSTKRFSLCICRSAFFKTLVHNEA